MPDRAIIEQRILEAVRTGEHKQPVEILRKVMANSSSDEAKIVREAFGALISRGALYMSRNMEFVLGEQSK